MKKLVPLILLLSFLVSCTSNYDKAKALIKDDLESILKDPDSYQEVKSSQLYKLSINDNSLSELEQELFSSDIEFLVIFLKNLNNENEGTVKMSDYMVESYAVSIDSLCKARKITPNYYIVKHIYRAKNSFGGYSGDSKAWYLLDGKLETIKGRYLFD